MEDPKTCPSCRSSRLESAAFYGAALLPSKPTRMARATGGAEVRASVCLECGTIAGLSVDAERFRGLIAGS